jgi:hypothetical protein
LSILKTQRNSRWVRFLLFLAKRSSLVFRGAQAVSDKCRFYIVASFLFLIFLNLNTSAEYRAFELAISNPTTNQSRVVQTTLDHIQYPMYYLVRRDETIQIVSTWMCRNRTDNFEPICAKPLSKTPPALAQASALKASEIAQAKTLPGQPAEVAVSPKP